MIDHGYIGNYSPDGEIIDPCYVDEEFVDAHTDVASLDGNSSSSSNTDDYDLNVTNDDEIRPPAIELPSSFPILASGCLTIPKFTNYAVVSILFELSSLSRDLVLSFDVSVSIVLY